MSSKRRNDNRPQGRGNRNAILNKMAVQESQKLAKALESSATGESGKTADARDGGPWLPLAVLSTGLVVAALAKVIWGLTVAAVVTLVTLLFSFVFAALALDKEQAWVLCLRRNTSKLRIYSVVMLVISVVIVGGQWLGSEKSSADPKIETLGFVVGDGLAGMIDYESREPLQDSDVEFAELKFSAAIRNSTRSSITIQRFILEIAGRDLELSHYSIDDCRSTRPFDLDEGETSKVLLFHAQIERTEEVQKWMASGLVPRLIVVERGNPEKKWISEPGDPVSAANSSMLLAGDIFETREVCKESLPQSSTQ